MVLYLTEAEKVAILIFATSLFLLSVIITVCVVSPVCWLHKLLFKSSKGSTKGQQKHQLITPESKHFQLTVVPHYGSSTLKSTSSASSTKSTKLSSTKESSGKSQISQAASESIPPSEIKVGIFWESTSDNTIGLHINIYEVTRLRIREYGVEPACYVVVDVMWHGSRSRRKSLNNKLAATFRSATSKRSLNPTYDESFVTSELPKSILKDGKLKIKVFDDEKYANDCCLAETTISLKHLTNEKEPKHFDLANPKECKGELLIGLCYLPTSRRVTIAIVKAALNNHASNGASNLCYYVRVLMFINGKLSKKKRTTTSEKLNWGDQEVLTFDLTSNAGEQTAFMVVLSSRNDAALASVSSPSSPETPPDSLEGSRKDRHIGHFVIGDEIWKELRTEPRKLISKWIKLV